MLDDFPSDISNRYTGLGAGRIIIHSGKGIDFWKVFRMQSEPDKGAFFQQ